MTYKEKREKLEKLNLDLSHYNNSNDICTPMSCVEEMVDAIPEELWNRKNIKILDPCCGNGNFPVYIETKVKNNYELILNDINKVRLEIAKEIITKNVLFYNKDFFSFIEKKYDLIIANPPFAKFSNGKRAAKNHSLSREFIKHSYILLKENGYLVYIIPDNWMSLSDRNDLVEILSRQQFIKIDIHGAKKYFPKVGSSFTWFVWKKTDNKNKTEINNNYLKKEISNVQIKQGIKSLPLFYNEQVKSILDKTLYSSNKKIKIETSSDLHKYTKKDLLSKERSNEFIYKVWHTQKQLVWSKRKHKFQDGWKVYISLTSYYSTFIDENTGMTQSIAFVRCKSKEEAEKLKKILDHPLYKFINNIHRYGNFNNIRILQLFPYPENDNDIYKSFNITSEEVSLINEILKI